jgi:type VI secretion system ImpB/VipA family protein
MSDGVPKSRVTLVYDTKQPEGREKPRELPFRLLVLGDVGGDKSAPLDHRKVRQLNGRNLGEVIKGLKVEVRDIDLGDAPAGGKPRKLNVLIDSMSSFAPDDVLRLLTGQ